MARRPSSIDRLPAEIREKIGQLRRDGHTIDEILAALDGVAVSRSALGRHTQKLDRLGDDLQRAQAMVESLTTRLSEKSAPNRHTQLVVELMHTALMQLFLKAGGDEAEDGLAQLAANPKQFAALASAVAALARAQVTDADYQRAVEARIREQVNNENRAAITELRDRQGLSAETAAAIFAGLGLAT